MDIPLESLKSSDFPNHLVIIESLKAIEKFILNKGQIINIHYSHKISEDIHNLSTKYDLKANIFKSYSQNEFELSTSFKFHKGAIAVGLKPNLIYESEINQTVVVLNGITSPENMGSICRSMSAFNFNILGFDQKTIEPYHRRPIRVSLGNIFYLKAFKIISLKESLINLKSRGFRILAFDKRKDSISIQNIKPDPKTVLLFGSEGHGIDPDIYEFCDCVVHIPMDNKAQYLNVATAVSIALYEFSSKNELIK